MRAINPAIAFIRLKARPLKKLVFKRDEQGRLRFRWFRALFAAFAACIYLWGNYGGLIKDTTNYILKEVTCNASVRTDFAIKLINDVVRERHENKITDMQMEDHKTALKAIEELKSVRACGSEKASLLLGTAHCVGIGVKPDKAKAAGYYAEAFRRGHVEAITYFINKELADTCPQPLATRP